MSWDSIICALIPWDLSVFLLSCSELKEEEKAGEFDSFVNGFVYVCGYLISLYRIPVLFSLL